MKLKITITLSEDLAKRLDALSESGESRSEVIERILRQDFVELEKRKRDLRDLELINLSAELLNEEAEDALSYQVEL